MTSKSGDQRHTSIVVERSDRVAHLGAVTLVLSLAAVSTGCLGSAHHGDLDTPVDVPETWTVELPEATETDERLDARWWRGLGMPGLNTAIDEALEGNLELRAAFLRVEQAETFVRQAQSGWYPNINAEVSVSRSRTPAPQPLGPIEANSFDASVSAGYEVDIWGRTLAASEAAEMDVRATRANAEASALSLAARIAEAWIDVRYHRARLKLVEEQIETADALLEVTLARLNIARASALDVLQQRQNLEALRSSIPLIESQEEIARVRLALLLGRDPSRPVDVPGDTLPALPATVPGGLPADLLEARPDVRAARRRAEAADSRIVVAVANRLPSLRLSASLFLSADEIGNLFDEIFWSVAASLSGVIWDGGRLDAEIDRAHLVLEESVLIWGQTVLRAIEEVQTALILERQQRLYIETLEERLELAEMALERARLQFAGGVSDYQRVISTLVSLQTLQSSMLDAQRQLISHRITLYRALGGTWTQDLEAPPRPVVRTRSNESDE